MKFQNTKNKSTALAPMVLALAGALLVGFTSFAVVGGVGVADENERDTGGDPSGEDDGSGGTGGNGGANGGGWMTDEEAVGTLPTHGGSGDPPPPPTRHSFTAPATFFLEGPHETVRAMVVGIDGEGYVTQEVVGDGTSAGSKTALSFHGELRIILDASFVNDPRIRAGVQVRDQIGTTIAAAMTDDELLLTEVLPSTASLTVPFDRFESAGVLTDGVHLITNNTFSGRGYFGMERYAGIVEIYQGRPQNNN